jgi:hypothetical protein
MQRRRSKPHSFVEQLSREKARLQAQLADLSGGPERDTRIEKIRQIETASHINEWLSSPGLKPPDR